MAAEMSSSLLIISAGLNPCFKLLPTNYKPFSNFPFQHPLPLISSTTTTMKSRKRDLLTISANFGGGDGEVKKGGKKKKFITKDEEPQQYWQTAGERQGENPMKTPLPYIIIFGMSTPFVILAIAFANGWIKVPVR